MTPALTLPQVRYGLSVLLLEVYCVPGIDYICRQVQRQLQRNESARFGIVSEYLFFEELELTITRL